MQFLSWFLMIVLLFTSLFLIVLILIQRGKGGGLAGAFGGMGGQSAFGTKAGDLFTKITVGLAIFWIVLLMVMVKVLGVPSSKVSEDIGGAASKNPDITAPVEPGNKPAGTQSETPALPAGSPEKSEPAETK